MGSQAVDHKGAGQDYTYPSLILNKKELISSHDKLAVHNQVLEERF